MLGVPLVQIGETKAQSRSRQVGKVVVLVSLLGLACVAFWALSNSEQAAEEPATSMAIAPMQQAARPQSFMRPVAVQASKIPRSDNIARISNAQSEELMTKRQMMAGLAASAGAALPFAANAGVERVPKNLKNFDGKGPAGLLLIAPGAAISWALFNILGPANNQLETTKDDSSPWGNAIIRKGEKRR